MKAFRVNETAEGPAVVASAAPRPRPGEYELLVRVCAAGVTQSELDWYPTWHGPSGEKREGAIPGHEFSGVVVEVGPNVGDLEIGREVFGMNGWYQDGAAAEYCVAPFPDVAPKPADLSHTEAASVPIAALTSWQGLMERAALQPGERVLIHGAAGGVGVYAVQIARLAGAHVIATAAARDKDFVRELGAHEFVDYNGSRFEDQVRDIDVVFDTVGGEVLYRSWNVLKAGGRVVTIAAVSESDTKAAGAFFIVEPNQKQLYHIADLIEWRRLRPVVQAVLPMEKADQAWRPRKGPHAPGKVVVVAQEAS